MENIMHVTWSAPQGLWIWTTRSELTKRDDPYAGSNALLNAFLWILYLIPANRGPLNPFSWSGLVTSKFVARLAYNLLQTESES